MNIYNNTENIPATNNGYFYPGIGYISNFQDPRYPNYLQQNIQYNHFHNSYYYQQPQQFVQNTQQITTFMAPHLGTEGSKESTSFLGSSNELPERRKFFEEKFESTPRVQFKENDQTIQYQKNEPIINKEDIKQIEKTSSIVQPKRILKKIVEKDSEDYSFLINNPALPVPIRKNILIENTINYVHTPMISELIQEKTLSYFTDIEKKEQNEMTNTLQMLFNKINLTFLNIFNTIPNSYISFFHGKILELFLKNMNELKINKKFFDSKEEKTSQQSSVIFKIIDNDFFICFNVVLIENKLLFRVYESNNENIEVIFDLGTNSIFDIDALFAIIGFRICIWTENAIKVLNKKTK